MPRRAMRPRRRRPRPPWWWLLLFVLVCGLALAVYAVVTMVVAVVSIATDGVSAPSVLWLIGGSLYLCAFAHDLKYGITIGCLDLPKVLCLLSAACYYASAHIG